MCLGIPGKVVAWVDRTPLFETARVEFGGVERACNMACVPNAELGDYVIVHAGVAIAVIDAEEAARVFREFEAIDSLAVIPSEPERSEPL